MAGFERGCPGGKPTEMSVQPELGKDAIRSAMRQKLRGLDGAQRADWSAAILNSILSSESWRSAKSVLLFVPMVDEPDLWALAPQCLADGKALALPRFARPKGEYESALVTDLDRDLQPGQYGIKEPGPHCPAAPVNQLDLILVPGVAFAPGGHRLGRGKGFYDRLLQGVCGVRMGVAFDFQIVDQLPIAPHDERLNLIVTPTRWLSCAART